MMKARWQAFRKQYWDVRTPEERRTIALGALLLAPLLYYTVLWQPAHAAVRKLRLQLPLLHSQLEVMRAQVTTIESLRHQAQPAPLDAASIKDLVEASALRHQLKDSIATLELMPPNGVRISLASIPFEKWLFWLRNLQQEQLLRADAVSVVALPQPGMVRVSATLVSGGAQ